MRDFAKRLGPESRSIESAEHLDALAPARTFRGHSGISTSRRNSMELRSLPVEGRGMELTSQNPFGKLNPSGPHLQAT
jgi:hypothetical protein